MKYFVLAIFLNSKNARVSFMFQYGFENWIFNVFGNQIACIKFRISSFFMIFEKELFKVSVVSDFKSECFFIFSPIYFLCEYCLVRELSFHCLPKFLIHNIFLIQILLILFFSLFQER